MARNTRNKQKHTTRRQMNAYKITNEETSYLPDDKEYSVRLSRVIDDAAVNEQFIQFKRKIMRSDEREKTLTHKAFGNNRRAYIFGSKIEGTSTDGTMSDADFLDRIDTFRLFLDSENPPLQPHYHKSMITVSTNGCASQYCVLTMIEPTQQRTQFDNLDPYRDPLDLVDFFQKRLDNN
ncbi:hypothetical protein DPMN_057519 [Dreissena polymorpha]|uniref:Uncharacterized protein n=1 Tax=Dreissena polymorpha TaxID=45954 RepID=A0A9D4C043_DREPO|nr:hypothetical protein DPMN_057519 [Dreissena polymorpha]